MTDTSALPLVLLDFDGVINIDSPAPRRTHISADGERFPINWNPDVVARVSSWHSGGVAEVLWSTSWVQHVDKISLHLSMPALGTAWSPAEHPVFPGFDAAPALSYAYGTALRALKLRTALHHAVAGRRMVWLDDEIRSMLNDGARAMEWPHVLLIAPEEAFGLQARHLDTVEAHLRGAA